MPISKPIKVVLRRHGEKSKSNYGLDLSSNGMKQAITVGTKISKKTPTKFYSSSVPRANQTARLIKESLNGSGGRVYSSDVRVRKKMGEDLIFAKNNDYTPYFKYMKGFKTEVEAYRAWTLGKTPEGLFKSPNQVVYDVIKNISLAQYIQKRRNQSVQTRKLTENEFKGINLDYTGHSWINDIVFETLTGKRITTVTKETEPINFTFYSNGRIALVFRKERFDVTRKFNEILSQKK